MEYFRKRVNGHDGGAIQESQHLHLSSDKDFHFLRKSFHVLGSCALVAETEKSVGGGVIILVSKKLAKSAQLEELVVIPGRAVRVKISFPGSCLKIWNVHNFGISAAEWRDANEISMEDLENDLMSNDTTMVLGDWNCICKGEMRYSLSNPTNGVSPGAQNAAVLRGPFFRTLEKFTEIGADGVTHYFAASGTLARLDRAYVSLPRWQLALLRTVAVRHDPVRLREQGLSDHAPLNFSIAPVSSSVKYKPIPSFVTTHPIFAEVLEQWQGAVDLGRMSPIERWTTHKSLIIEAARVTRDRLFAQDDPKIFPMTMALRLSSIARMVWENNIALYQRLRSKDSLVEEHVTLELSLIHI